jgi:CheY-like chemotaxis protein
MLTHDQATVAEISPPLESPPVRSAILVAEDSVVLQTMVKQLLERLGCSVEIVSTGKEAVEASSKRHFNLILMDWQMPEMDGLEATRLIRASENAAGRHTPIIAMTANAMQGDKDKCMEAGMDGYLAKPFKLDELKAIVSQYKSESGSEEQNAA